MLVFSCVLLGGYVWCVGVWVVCGVGWGVVGVFEE